MEHTHTHKSPLFSGVPQPLLSLLRNVKARGKTETNGARKSQAAFVSVPQYK